MKSFDTYDEAYAESNHGDEIWVKDTRYEKPWRVMTSAQADEYVAKTPFKEYIHWETV